MKKRIKLFEEFSYPRRADYSKFKDMEYSEFGPDGWINVIKATFKPNWIGITKDGQEEDPHSPFCLGESLPLGADIKFQEVLIDPHKIKKSGEYEYYEDQWGTGQYIKPGFNVDLFTEDLQEGLRREGNFRYTRKYSGPYIKYLDGVSKEEILNYLNVEHNKDLAYYIEDVQGELKEIAESDPKAMEEFKRDYDPKYVADTLAGRYTPRTFREVKHL